MATVFAEEAIRIHEVAHLSDVQMGRAVGAAPSTVRDWFARRSSPTGKRAERVAELAEIVDRLARVIEPNYIPVWMSRPIEAERAGSPGSSQSLSRLALSEVRISDARCRCG